MPFVPLVVVFAALAVGVLAVLAPLYLIGGITAVGVIFLLAWKPLARAAVVLAASLGLLQISAATSSEKLIYLAIVVAATVFAAANLVRQGPALRGLGAVPLMWAAFVVASLVAISAGVALVNQIALTAWVADVPAYALLSVAIVLGLDLAVSGERPTWIAALLLVAGTASAFAFGVQWSANHGVSQADLGRVLFASMFLPGAALCLAIAYAFDGRATYRMAFLVVGLLSAMFITGTRSSAMFILPIVFTFLAARGARRWRIAQLMIGGAVAAVVLGTALAVTGVVGSLNLELVQVRLASVIPLLLSGNLSTDPSLYLRELQTQSLQAAWLTSPLFGVGPGAKYVYSGVTVANPVDSPLAVFARFGVVGVVGFVLFFVALLRSPLRRKAHWVPRTALLSFIVLIGAWGLVSSPLDDKGVALALIPLMGLCGVWRPSTPSLPAAAPAGSSRGLPRSDRGGAA